MSQMPIMHNVSTSSHGAQKVVSINRVVVVKSVMKIVVIIVIKIEPYISRGNETWDDYRISKVQRRSQL